MHETGNRKHETGNRKHLDDINADANLGRTLMRSIGDLGSRGSRYQTSKQTPALRHHARAHRQVLHETETGNRKEKEETEKQETGNRTGNTKQTQRHPHNTSTCTTVQVQQVNFLVSATAAQSIFQIQKGQTGSL